MKNAKLNRRLFLRGAAGFTLALPVLPSLLEDEAEAAPTGVRRFVAFGTPHGGVWPQNMYPTDPQGPETMTYGGHPIRRSDLPMTANNGRNIISPVLSAASDVLTEQIRSKLNLVRGLDVTFYLAHHRGGHLGNYAENDGNGMDGQALTQHRPTIDQIMAWSDNFYPNLSTILERSLVIGRPGMSANWSNPGSQSGVVQNITPESNSLVLFNRIFVPDDDPMETRPPIVDRVIDDYHRLRQGNRRLSAEDRRRLDDHLDRLDELQRKLNVAVSCGDIPVPTVSSNEVQNQANPAFHLNASAQAQYWSLLNDVIVAAFICDTSRIASILAGTYHSDYDGDWHQEIAHQSELPTWPFPNTPLPDNGGPSPQSYTVQHHQRFFEDVFLDLVGKLDAVPDGDGTLLDRTLVQWTQESGSRTHDPIELPIVTAGSGDEYFRTGQYVDYRNLNSPAHNANGDNAVDSHTGLVYNQWLGTVCTAMGLDKNEYESGQYGGYGELVLSSEGWYAGQGKYPSAVLDVMGEELPYLKS